MIFMTSSSNFKVNTYEVLFEGYTDCNFAVTVYRFDSVLGSCRLCRHNFEKTRCAWEFENILGIIGNFLRIMSDTS